MWKSYSTSVDQKVLASSHLPKDLKRIKPEKNCMAPLLRVEKLRYVLIIMKFVGMYLYDELEFLTNSGHIVHLYNV